MIKCLPSAILFVYWLVAAWPSIKRVAERGKSRSKKINRPGFDVLTQLRSLQMSVKKNKNIVMNQATNPQYLMLPSQYLATKMAVNTIDIFIYPVRHFGNAVFYKSAAVTTIKRFPMEPRLQDEDRSLTFLHSHDPWTKKDWEWIIRIVQQHRLLHKTAFSLENL